VAGQVETNIGVLCRLIDQAFNDAGQLKYRQANDQFDGAGNVRRYHIDSLIGDDVTNHFEHSWQAGTAGYMMAGISGHMRVNSRQLAGRDGATVNSTRTYDWYIFLQQ